MLRPCILWNDGRSAAECEALEREWPALRDVTGNRAMPGFTAPKLRWVRDHEPQVFARIAMVLLPKAYVRLQLSGEAIEEMSDASGTLWLDVAHRQWSETALAATSLDLSQMPRLVEGCEPAGTLRRELAARWGMREGVVIGGGFAHDALTCPRRRSADKRACRTERRPCEPANGCAWGGRLASCGVRSS